MSKRISSDSPLTVQTLIEVRFQFEGMHCWPMAPKEVEFLRSPHRHMFHARVRCDVAHSDRELEFILVKRDLQHFISNFGGDFGTFSCEAIAQRIFWYMRDEYGRTSIEVEISEDGENGAIVRTI